MKVGRLTMFNGTFLQLLRKSIILCAALAVPLAAQTGLGVVRGTVRDASEAVVPNAKATLSSVATGIDRTAQTNADGIYDFENIPVGPYKLVIEAAGFKRWEGT